MLQCCDYRKNGRQQPKQAYIKAGTAISKTQTYKNSKQRKTNKY